MDSVASVTFRGFSETEDHTDLMDFLRGLLNPTLDAFVVAERHHLDLKLHHQIQHNNQRNHLFECEAILWINGERNPIVVRRSDRNFYAAANACNAALRNALSHRARRLERRRVRYDSTRAAFV